MFVFTVPLVAILSASYPLEAKALIPAQLIATEIQVLDDDTAVDVEILAREVADLLPCFIEKGNAPGCELGKGVIIARRIGLPDFHAVDGIPGFILCHLAGTDIARRLCDLFLHIRDLAIYAKDLLLHGLDLGIPLLYGRAVGG